MAIIYDFPTNVEAKLSEVDELLEKNYVDQAICLLEDFLDVFKQKQAAKEVYKKLIDCYLLKKEFDACEDIILQLRQLGCLDLSIAAHDIVVCLLQGQEQVGQKKQELYRQELGLTTVTHKNLMELVFQVKTIYEDHWLNEAKEAFMALLQAQGFESMMNALVSLQQVEMVYFEQFQEMLLTFFATDSLPIVKTMVFELGIQKGLALEVIFIDKLTREQKVVTKADLDAFYRTISSLQSRLKRLELDEFSESLLEQQLMMFYQSMFPFFDRIEGDEVVEYLLNPGLVNQEETYTAQKISQYLLSLSSLV